MPSRSAVVRSPGEGRVIPLGIAGDVTLKVARPDNGGSMTVYEFSMPAGMAGPPLHIHHTWDEMFYVLDGEMTFLLDGETRLAPAGSCVFIPHGCAHTFWNAGAGPARQLTVLHPSGIEDYFDEASAALANGGEESLEAARSLMESYDITLPESDGPAYGRLDSAS